MDHPLWTFPPSHKALVMDNLPLKKLASDQGTDRTSRERMHWRATRFVIWGQYWSKTQIWPYVGLGGSKIDFEAQIWFRVEYLIRIEYPRQTNYFLSFSGQSRTFWSFWSFGLFWSFWSFWVIFDLNWPKAPF